MKDRNPPAPNEPVPLVILLPIDDHRIYLEARRVLRCLMGRKAPRIETLLLHDVRGRDTHGIVDNYLDAIEWPLYRGRAVTIKLREETAREVARSRKPRRQCLRLARPPADPARN